MHLPRSVVPYNPAQSPDMSEEEQRRLMEAIRLQQMQQGSGRGVALDDGPVYAPPPVDDPVPPVEGKAPVPYSPAPAVADGPRMLTERNRENITRPRRVGPEPPPATDPLIIRGEQGQPRAVEGGGTDAEKNKAYLAALQSYKPANHNSRLKSIGLGAVRAWTRGGSPIAGAVESAIDPSTDERFANEREIARVGRAVQTDYAQSKADKDLAKPAYEPDILETEQGPVYAQGPGKPAVPIYDPEGARVGPKPKAARTTAAKTEIRHDPITGKAEKWTLGEEGQPDKKVEGWGDPAKDLVKVKGRWVPPSTAVTAEAISGEREYRHGRDLFEDSRHETERTEDKTTAKLEKDQNRTEKAGKVQGNFEAARQKWMAADAKISDAKTKLQTEENSEQKIFLQNLIYDQGLERDEAQKEATTASTELSTSFGDMFESGIADKDENGVPNPGRLPYVKWRPFSVKQLKQRVKGITQARIDAAIKNAKDRGQPVVD